MQSTGKISGCNLGLRERYFKIGETMQDAGYLWYQRCISTGSQNPPTLIVGSVKQRHLSNNERKNLTWKDKKCFSKFREFISWGSKAATTIGVIFGGTLTVIVTSLMNDTVMPSIGILLVEILYKTYKKEAGNPNF